MFRFVKILCQVGDGLARERQIDRAVELALHHQASLTVVDVFEPRPRGWEILDSELPEDAVTAARARVLERAVAQFRSSVDIETRAVCGMPFLCMIKEVLRGGHDLVIRESEDPGWLDRVLGSDDMHLLRKCPCPVWLVDPSAQRTCRRVLAAVDVDRQYPANELATRHALNRRVLDLACSIAIAESAELHVVHAWHAVSATYPGIPVELLNEYIERTRSEHTSAFAELIRETTEAIGSEASDLLERQDYLVDGNARREIPRLAKRIGADLVVMGSVARTGVPGLFVGNTAETILAQLDSSVLIVKPPGFITPVSATPGAAVDGTSTRGSVGNAGDPDERSDISNFDRSGP